MASDFAGEVEDFEHGGAFANDAVKFEILEELFLEGANARTLIVEIVLEGDLFAGDVVRGEEGFFDEEKFVFIPTGDFDG